MTVKEYIIENIIPNLNEYGMIVLPIYSKTFMYNRRGKTGQNTNCLVASEHELDYASDVYFTNTKDNPIKFNIRCHLKADSNNFDFMQ